MPVHREGSAALDVRDAPDVFRCFPFDVFLRISETLEFPKAPVAQLDRVTASEAVGCGFDPRRVQSLSHRLSARYVRAFGSGFMRHSATTPAST